MISSFSKKNFNIEKFNTKLKDFCKKNNVESQKLLNLQLISEEFLSNIIFPDFEGKIKSSLVQKKESLVLSFEYEGIDYMNKINETTIISLKILENKAKEILKKEKDGKIKVSFVV